MFQPEVAPLASPGPCGPGAVAQSPDTWGRRSTAWPIGRKDAPCHALDGHVGEGGEEKRGYDLAQSRTAGAVMVVGSWRRRTRG
jgi:hypothetical protein